MSPFILLLAELLAERLTERLLNAGERPNSSAPTPNSSPPAPAREPVVQDAATAALDVTPYLGQPCAIRCRDAGVWYGLPAQINGRTVELRDAYRIWRWRGALTLSHLATEDTPLDHEWTRIAPPMQTMLLLDAAEVLPITPAALARLQAVPIWVNPPAKPQVQQPPAKTPAKPAPAKTARPKTTK